MHKLIFSEYFFLCIAEFVDKFAALNLKYFLYEGGECCRQRGQARGVPIISRKVASSMTGMPSEAAFSRLAGPMFSPAKR